MRAGETVLIQGTGGVSIFATQLVVALGGRPLVLSSSDEKLQRIRELGAEWTLNYRSNPDWVDAVLQLTGGQGVDHVIEVVGGENLNRSLEAVKVSGTISFIGLMAGLSAPIQTYRFVTKNVTIQGIETGSRRMLEEMAAFLAEHRITPVVSREFSFDRVADALHFLDSRTHFGKVVVRANRL